MKKVLLMTIFAMISFSAFAEDDSDVEKQVTDQKQDKMTIRDAKALCKAEGKKGKDLVLCIKEKKKK